MMLKEYKDVIFMNYCSNDFNINYNRCRDVVKVLDNYYINKKDLADVFYPSNILYKSKEYYLYMFYSCLLDYGMKSKIYHNNLANTYKLYPNIFEPIYVISMNKDELMEIIVSNIHPRYPNVAVKKWIRLSLELVKYENILSYLKRIDSILELNRFIKGLNSYGQKTGGLLSRIIIDSSICNFNENIDSIPIDRHDIEISYLVGIINKNKITNNEIKLLSDTYVKIGMELGINPSNIDKYLWEIGNSFCNKKNCLECPLGKFCSRE